MSSTSHGGGNDDAVRTALNRGGVLVRRQHGYEYLGRNFGHPTVQRVIDSGDAMRFGPYVAKNLDEFAVCERSDRCDLAALSDLGKRALLAMILNGRAPALDKWEPSWLPYELFRTGCAVGVETNIKPTDSALKRIGAIAWQRLTAAQRDLIMKIADEGQTYDADYRTRDALKAAQMIFVNPLRLTRIGLLAVEHHRQQKTK